MRYTVVFTRYYAYDVEVDDDSQITAIDETFKDYVKETGDGFFDKVDVYPYDEQ